MSAVKEAFFIIVRSLPDHCTLEDIQRQLGAVGGAGERVLAMAKALALANKQAEELGIDPTHMDVRVVGEGLAEEHLWRVEYSLTDFLNRRGGDLIVYVDARMGTIRNLLRGQ